MGLPIINPAYVDPLTNSSVAAQAMKRSINNKRSVYSSYIKRNGELICTRKFCRLCLKQNYDCVLPDIIGKHDWVCPFCTGNCYCSRCLRNDHINKLFGLFITLGGDLNEVNKDSCLQKYVLSQDLEDFSKQNPNKKIISYYALKPTPGRKLTKFESTELKDQVKKYRENLKSYQFYKNIRIHMEKVRLLCSQVSKRENLKLRVDLMDKELFEAEQLGDENLSGKKRKGKKIEKHVDEPKLTKKRVTRVGLDRDIDYIENEEADSSEEYDSEEFEEEEEEGSFRDEDDEEEEDEELSDGPETEEIPIKRKRGRPRKEEPPKVIDKRTPSVSSKPSLIPEKEIDDLPKRKRGRPPKNPPLLLSVEKSSPQKGASSTPEKRDKFALTPRPPTTNKEKLVKTPDTKFRDNNGARQEQRSASSRRKKLDYESDDEGDYKVKGPILKKELQKILSHQSWNQFDLLNASKMMGRVTRNSFSRATLKKGRKNRANQEP